MTPEEKSLLERTFKFAEDNNKILHNLRRSNRISTIIHISYWVLIIVLSFGAFYFIQPYINALLGASGQATGISGVQNSINQTQNAANSLRDLFK